MITIKLFGMDSYEAIRYTKKLNKKLAELYDVSENEIEFFACEGFIIHNGFEQTNFRLDVEIEAPEQFEELENEVKDSICDFLREENVAVHFRFLFTYFDPSHEYLLTDESYPLYMNDNNTVKAKNEEDEEVDTSSDSDDEEEYDEPYMGDIIGEFDEFIKNHPNATNREIYEALAGIREDVTSKHFEANAKKQK